MEKAFILDIFSKIYIASDHHPVDESYELCGDMLDVVIDTGCIYGQSQDKGCGDSQNSQCTIMLSNGYLLYLREVDRFLMLACLIKDDAFDRSHFVDHNINLFRNALQRII